MRRFFPCLIPLIAAALLANCGGVIDLDVDTDRVEGNGSITTEQRQVSEFERVSLAGEGRVVIERGAPALSIETDENLLMHIDSAVSGDTLEIKTDNGIDLDPSDGITYRIATDRLVGVALSGAGDIDTGDWEADDFTIELSGAGDIDVSSLVAGDVDVTISGVGQVTITGTADSLTVSMPGAGSFEGGDLETRAVAVTATGAGSATLWATETLDANLTGVGSIDYFGRPTVNQTVTGVGTITSRGEK